MKNVTLTLQCEREMDCPKEVVMWNYYDHEHLVGTHYKYYNSARVLAERDDWALVYRKMKMPILPFNCSGVALQFMENNVMKTFHKDSVGFLLEMEVHFKDLPNDKSLIKVIYKINTHPFFKILEPIFQKLFQRWFHATWVEDEPMRLRRWKVHKLGFKDFNGIDYINKKNSKPEKMEVKKYEFKPPIKSYSTINTKDGIERLFKESIEVGYNDK
ncbi:MAG: hypothetical protein A3B68_09910 [Candidatus Melainabacteria bacterium RIFCSPHIGHO2_02_FULL_34_12]|nr:MAG: hypothetical protein A3B68_09910 [Candidatus Melainabacteria bacterium RIFCSPHIGHO2_02_FULL_34_12]